MISKCIVPLDYFVIGPVTDYLIPDFLKSKKGFAVMLRNIFGAGNLNYRSIYLFAGVIAIVCAMLFFSQKSLRNLEKEK